MSFPGKDITRVLHFLEENDLQFVDMKTPRWSLRLVRGETLNVIPDTVAQAEYIPESDSTEIEDQEKEAHIVTSPFVGVFFSTAVSDVYKTLRKGDPVKKGQVLRMVEAMDVEHLVRSGCNGVIETMLTDDGSPVEYGTPLISIRCEESDERTR